MGRIRAKFRCMSIEKTWNRMSNVRLAPVMADDGHPENAKFWGATPSGEAMLEHQGDCDFEPGAYYYIDMRPRNEGDDGPEWTVDSIRRQTHGGEVVLSYGRRWETQMPDCLHRGEVKMSIEQLDTLALFGEPGVAWDVRFSFAEKSRD